MGEIRVYHTHIEVYPYKEGDCPEIEKSLSKKVYVNKHSNYYVWKPVCFFINNDTLYLPRGINSSLLEHYFRNTPIMVSKCDDYERCTKAVGLLEPKSTMQENGIKFLCGTDEYAYTNRYSQLGLNLATGDGKTYATIYSVLKYGLKTIIITDKDKLKLQWMESFKVNSNFPEDKLLNISGSDVMRKIMDDKVEAEIYFVNHQTIASYAKSNGWDSVREFFKKIKVGIKVIDEAHEFFESTFMIDNFSNCFKTFYLTATFGRSDQQEVRIYKKAFQSLTRFGEETYDYEEKRKHTHFIVCYFHSRPPYGYAPSVKTNFGFSNYKYIDYELEEENKSIFKALYQILDQTKDLKGKTLILSPKTETVEIFAEAIRDRYGYDVGTVHSKNTEEENKENIQKDVISSTIKSLGTGMDIKGLRVLINLDPISSKLLAEQVRGRLREFSEEDDTFLFYPVDTTVQECCDSLKRIMPTMKKQCKEIHIIHLNV